MSLNFLADYATSSTTSSGGSAVVSIIYFALIILLLAGMWKMFSKAGRPGWQAIVPIYNAYVLVKIAGRPGWWFLLFLIPIVNFVVSIIIAMDIAVRFGKSKLWGALLIGVLGIGYLILGFGSSTYSETPQV